jgi:hypothetical protein
MTFLGVFGILLGLLGARFAFIQRTRLRVSFFAANYVFHLIATFAYYIFSINNVTDAGGYYYDYGNYYEDVGFGYGSLFITYVVQGLKRLVGGTFLDYFLLFQAISFFGICMLMRVLEEVYMELQIEQPLYIYLLPFLPGLHFWTSAIGKDGFLLLGACLAIWAAMNIRKRYWAMAAALGIMMLIRPYIAPIGIAALGGAIFLDRRTRLSVRVLIVAVSLGGLGFALGSVEQSFAVDVTNADSVSEWLAAHEEVTADAETAGNSAVYGSYPFKLMSLLFRPMFLDAENIMGMAASVENFILLVLLIGLVAKLRTTVAVARNLSFFRFALIFGVAVTLVLAVTYFNIGLGLRHKTMFVPAVMVLFATVMGVSRARRETQAPDQQVPAQLWARRGFAP